MRKMLEVNVVNWMRSNGISKHTTECTDCKACTNARFNRSIVASCLAAVFKSAGTDGCSGKEAAFETQTESWMILCRTFAEDAAGFPKDMGNLILTASVLFFPFASKHVLTECKCITRSAACC